MSSRSNKQLIRVMTLSLIAVVWAQPQPPYSPAPPPVGNGSISGSVSNSVTNAPLPRAHVTVLILGNTGAQSFGAETDAEGKFSIAKLPPGRFIVQVDRVGFVAPSGGQQNIGYATKTR